MECVTDGFVLHVGATHDTLGGIMFMLYVHMLIT